jgi:AMP deaminase
MEKLLGAPVTSESMANPRKNLDLNEELAQELEEIFDSFEKCIELRAKYMHFSLQFDGDNPKDLPDWKIFPNPPKPSYPVPRDADGNEIPPPPPEVFDFQKCEIPGRIDENIEFRLDKFGIYQFYSTQGKFLIN